ncbi:MAG: hypothetical protein AB1801_23130 [Chloroflexota bacterium]
MQHIPDYYIIHSVTPWVEYQKIDYNTNRQQPGNVKPDFKKIAFTLAGYRKVLTNFSASANIGPTNILGIYHLNSFSSRAAAMSSSMIGRQKFAEGSYQFRMVQG